MLQLDAVNASEKNKLKLQGLSIVFSGATTSITNQYFLKYIIGTKFK